MYTLQKNFVAATILLLLWLLLAWISNVQFIRLPINFGIYVSSILLVFAWANRGAFSKVSNPGLKVLYRCLMTLIISVCFYFFGLIVVMNFIRLMGGSI